MLDASRAHAIAAIRVIVVIVIITGMPDTFVAVALKIAHTARLSPTCTT
jgi:hypothetical protein